jgi:hypothetical protein
MGRSPHSAAKRFQAAHSHLRELVPPSRNHALPGVVTLAHSTVNKVPRTIRWWMAHAGTIMSDDWNTLALQDLAEGNTLAPKGLKVRKKILTNHVAPEGDVVGKEHADVLQLVALSA